MSDTVRRIWCLWPSLDAMAADLNESAVELRRLRSEELLPDRRHDRAIVAMAMMNDYYITARDLERLRAEIRPKSQRLKAHAHAKNKLWEWMDAVGGRDEIVRLTGLTRKHVMVIRGRGHIPPRLRQTFEEIAEEKRVPLDPDLFERP